MAKKDSSKTKIMKDIGIAYDKPVTLSVDDLNDFQGDLKELSEESFAKLSKEIITTGFAFAPHAWLNPKDKKWYLTDGHQRVRTVRRLIKESGFRISKIPVVPVKARSFDEAKRRVLQAASQYGHIQSSGLFDFMKDAHLKMDEVRHSFDMPTIDFDRFEMAFFPKTKKVEFNVTEKPTEQEDEKTKEHRCPKCGFEFD